MERELLSFRIDLTQKEGARKPDPLGYEPNHYILSESFLKKVRYAIAHLQQKQMYTLFYTVTRIYAGRKKFYRNLTNSPQKPYPFTKSSTKGPFSAQ